MDEDHDYEVHSVVIDSINRYLETGEYEKFVDKASVVYPDRFEEEPEPFFHYWFLFSTWRPPNIDKNKKPDSLLKRHQRYVENHREFRNNKQKEMEKIAENIYSFCYEEGDFGFKNLAKIFRDMIDNDQVDISVGGRLEEDLAFVQLADKSNLKQEAEPDIDFEDQIPSFLREIFRESVSEVLKNRFDDINIPDNLTLKFCMKEESERVGCFCHDFNPNEDNPTNHIEINLADKSVPRSYEDLPEWAQDEYDNFIKSYFKSTLTHEIAHVIYTFDEDEYKFYTKKRDGQFNEGYHPKKWTRINEIITELTALLRGSIRDYHMIRKYSKRYSCLEDSIEEGNFKTVNGKQIDEIEDEIDVKSLSKKLTNCGLAEDKGYGYYTYCFKGTQYGAFRKALEDIEIMTGRSYSRSDLDYDLLTDQQEIKTILLDNEKGRKTNLWQRLEKEKEARYSEKDYGKRGGNNEISEVIDLEKVKDLSDDLNNNN